MNQFLQLSPKKRAFLAGTLLLTGTGFLCRALGFFYRIFLSRTIGAQGMGIFHIIHPVYGICFSLCAGSIQTALSQHIAAHTGQRRGIFAAGLAVSLGMSAAFALLICKNSKFLASRVLMEPACAPWLTFMAISLPFAAIHACVNGYYYGMQKSQVPALSQVMEQTLRMAFVFFLAGLWEAEGKEITVGLAVMGHLAGEAAAAAFTVLCLAARLVFSKQSNNANLPQDSPGLAALLKAQYFAPLLSLALPLMGNRLVINLLAGAEAIWIPNRLKIYGMSSQDAFSIYGVLTGMALPFVLFPSAISNSMAVLLLPGVAKAQAEGRHKSIAASIALSLRYSLYMGILCIGIFTLFGNALGTGVFHDARAGRFIQVLAWLCPFLYLATTTGSILNGLGRTHITFMQNTAAMVLRIIFVLVGIPRFGISACLAGMLASELLLAILHLAALSKLARFTWDGADMILKPAAMLVLSIGIFRFLEYHYNQLFAQSPFAEMAANIPFFLLTAFQIGIICLLYGGLLLLFHFWKNKSFCVTRNS